MVTVIRIIVFVIVVLPQIVLGSCSINEGFWQDDDFHQWKAIEWGIDLILLLWLPQLIYRYLISYRLEPVRRFCEEIKRGNYFVRLDVPTQKDELDEDIFVSFKRNMNWMIHQIEIRDREMHALVLELKEKKDAVKVQNDELVKKNTDLQLMQRRLEEKSNALEKMAMEDALTGLFNRRYYFQQMRKALAKQQKMTMIMLDIDYFKKVNDTYGHDIGDRVLEKVADVLKLYQKKACLVGRMGGEEFAVLMPEAAADRGTEAAEAIRGEIALEKVQLTAKSVCQVTVSIGVAVIEDTANMNCEKIYKQADNALYEAKKSGRNRVVTVVINDSMEI